MVHPLNCAARFGDMPVPVSGRLRRGSIPDWESLIAASIGHSGVARTPEPGQPRHMGPTTLRNATEKDIDLVLELIRALADFEHLGHEVTATRERLRDALFGPRPAAEVVLAFEGPVSVGFAVFHPNFSTFLGKPGIHLEDLFIRPEYRRRGHGQAILRHLARLATERGCGRLEWTVLDWNKTAIEFYERIGAVVLPDWRVCRMTGEALERWAQRAPTDPESPGDPGLHGS